MICENLKEEELELLENFPKSSIPVILSAIIRHLDIEYVLEKGKTHKNLSSDVSSEKRKRPFDRGNFNKKQKR